MAQDYSTNITGFYGTSVSAHGDHPNNWRADPNYGRASGYDNSVSYGIIRWNTGEVWRGVKQSGTPDQVFSYDFNVNRWRNHENEFPRFDPLPGGPGNTWDGAYRGRNVSDSGAPSNRNQPLGSWGWVTGTDTAEKFALHEAEGNISFADGAVTGVLKEEFDNISVAMHQQARGAKNSNGTSRGWHGSVWYEPW